MPLRAHMIVYAAPPHDAVRTVQCQCGWKATAEPDSPSDYRATMAHLLARWLGHVAPPPA
ncbi:MULTISPECIES: hypothetical protein [Sphingomonas]|jgi:hypothetical protein|uniref:Uncharacterized protein n=2 Tax=Sphingomonadaceae TaxID=41297 RepID=A0ABM7G5U2_9SPHN|nr:MULTISPECIES: hypothetical protein [Sphingomonas]BBF72514.1 hypothetical protein SBA_pBAR3_0810 [Sphingomonas bisphenolicum]